MNVLQKCCFRSMRENRKRTAVTVIGVVLATALITGVACLAVSLQASIVQYEKEQNGDYHYRFTGVVSENLKYFEHNQHVKKVALVETLGYAVLAGSQNPDKPYLYVRAADEEGMRTLALNLCAGRMPENDTELVIGRHIAANGLVRFELGEELTLDVGERMSEGYTLGQANPYEYEAERLETRETKTYTIVGIIDRPNYLAEARTAPGYSVFTYSDRANDPDRSGEAADSSFEVYVTYDDWGLRHVNQVNAGILGVSKDVYDRYLLGRCTAGECERIQAVTDEITENTVLLKWLLFSFSHSTMEIIYAMAGVAVLIIIVTAVFCIRNSFMISLMEKMKLYGRLASVGATTGQRRKIVYYEAAFLGLTGIPLGIASGILASVVLVRAVSGLVRMALDIPFIFGISLPAILVAAALSAVTIFCSALQSARRAAKVSPVSAIRSNDTVKIRGRELRCPAFIDKLFGVGGKVAYKNLKRARVKYRATVASIVVSVAVFIGMTTFVKLGLDTSSLYYNESPYQFQINLYDEDALSKAERIAALDGVLEVAIVRVGFIDVPADSLRFTERYGERLTSDEEHGMVGVVRSLGKDAYERFCRDVGVSAEEAKDKAIVIAEYEEIYRDAENRVHFETEQIARFEPGDVIKETDVSAVSLEVLVQTDKKPFSMEKVNYNTPVFIVSDDWMNDHAQSLRRMSDDLRCEVYLRCENDADMEENMRRNVLETGRYTLSNYAASYRSERSAFLVIAIFLYGFITVVALIGVTNIFNTVTTNMELRAPEFAMLRAVGMTDREFQRMIWLEGLFYGGKALLIGLPLGVFLSRLFYRALGVGLEMRFRLPFEGMAISVAAVCALLYGIMRYSLNKLERKDLIQIIQNENI